ncbi:hypothetical protein [Natronoglycomyces albus]|uniref:DUF2867 domain-containing protein n=1 Tax=Natronoglycomyces albus TaxID=2811108 RepID=A0A895XT79_9ACTN|nr:hypothetical protein [Natronoglycomyces albus]QSB06485.1 hypothetical protein JQS30_06170 [Natronoglycomyces albus]
MNAVINHVGPNDIPAEFVTIAAMHSADYADLFTRQTPGCRSHSAEQWARAMLEDEGGIPAQLLWRTVLGLRLRWRRGPSQVAGWPIGQRGPDWIRLEAHSRSLAARLVVHTGADSVSLGTFIRYDRRWGRRIWEPLSAQHRRLVPGLLNDAAHRLGHGAS